MRKCFLTGCYTGLLPKAPGTWGSLFGAVLAFFLLKILPQSTLFLLSILITIVAIKEINIYEKETKIHDDKRIVIDEIAGIWLAISLLPKTTLIWIILTLFFFRIFDIYKPSYIGKIDKNIKGGLGVMGDDLLAGVVAGLLSGLCYSFFFFDIIKI